MTAWFLVLSLWTAVGWAQSAPADDPNHDHVRVILDTSCSMSVPVNGHPAADLERRAVLSVLLLFDLVNPNLAAGDHESFVVLPFDHKWSWTPGSGSHPTQTRRLDAATLGGRAGLVSELSLVENKALATYFSPGVERAAADLKDSPGGIEDRRVIVIVTDGYPDRHAKAELDRLVALRPQLERHRISVFVLAFGEGITAAGGADKQFFHTFLQTPGHEIGKLWVDPDGGELLEKMAELFGEAFGYTTNTADLIGTGTHVDLAGGPDLSPLEVMLVGYHERPAEPQVLLTDAPGSLRPDRTLGAGVRSQHAYSLLTVARPPYQGGRYRVEGSAAASVVVLRKTLLTVELRDPTGAAIPKVMAGQRLDLQLLARPGAKRTGNTPEIQTQFEVHYGAPKGQAGHLEIHDKHRPTNTSRFDSAEGVRIYDFAAPFHADDPRPEAGRAEIYYPAFVVARAYRHKAFIARADPLPVHVYPKVKVAPDPSPLPLMREAGPGAVGPRDKGCASFRLRLLSGGGHLPDLGGGPQHHLEIRLAKGTRLDGALADAVVTVDGQPLDLQGAAPKGVWSAGRLMTQEEWFETDHEVCIATGPYRSKGGPRLVDLALTLKEPPYDRFDVVAGLKLSIDLKDPPPLALAMWWLLPLLLLLAALLSWLFSRHRPDVPPDFGYGLAPVGSPQGSWSWRTLERETKWPWSTPQYRVLHPGKPDVLGTLVPETSELYRFHPRTGTSLVDDLDGLIQAGQGYELRVGGVEYILRLDFEP